VLEATGQRRWNISTKIPFRDPQGKIIGLVGIGVTSQTQACRGRSPYAKCRSERGRKRHRHHNADGNYLWVNRAFTLLTGYERKKRSARIHVISLNPISSTSYFTNSYGIRSLAEKSGMVK